MRRYSSRLPKRSVRSSRRVFGKRRRMPPTTPRRRTQSRGAVLGPRPGYIASSRSETQKFLTRAKMKRAQGLNYGRAALRSHGKSGEEVLYHSHGSRPRRTAVAIPYRQLCDQMYPRLVERGEGLGFDTGVISTTPGQQAHVSEQYFNRIQIRTWMLKSTDANNINTITPVSSAESMDFVFQYLGGSVRYTFTNTTSHTAKLTLWDVQSRRYSNIGPTTRWNSDLANDNTLTNTTFPLNTEATQNTIGYRPGYGKASTWRSWFKKVKCTSIDLEPGQTYNYRIDFAPFKITGDKLNMYLSDGVHALFNPHSRFMLAFLHHPGLVLDPADDGVNHGSATVNVIRHFTHSYRTRFDQKGYQTYWTGGLDRTFTAGEAEINQETEDADVAIVRVT